ncbi:MAG: transposase [Fibrobacterota bacterium]
MAEFGLKQSSRSFLLDQDEARSTTLPDRSPDGVFAPWQLLGICDPRHRLVVLADSIAWDDLMTLIAAGLPIRSKWPSRNLRLVLGLLILSGGPDSSEEDTISRFEENIYWQYFCGLREVQWKCAVPPAVLARWKSLLTEIGWSALLETDLDQNRDRSDLAWNVIHPPFA